MNDDDSANESPPDRLLYQWVVAGIVASVARFVPVPFVDDVIRSQCRRFVVARTLASVESTLGIDALRPLFGDSGGCIAGCPAMVAKAPMKLLLFPIRKLVAMVTSVRGVPLEITRTVLLGRTLHRLLDERRLNAGQAELFMSAFDESFARMDFHVLQAAISDSLGSVHHWKSAAIEVARKLASQEIREAETIAESRDIKAAASQVQAAMHKTQTMQLFAEFDRRFDQSFSKWIAKRNA
jgi:hypothetical protein